MFLLVSVRHVGAHPDAEPSPAVFKAALHARGEIATPSVRAPLTPASPEAAAAMAAALSVILAG